MAEELNGSGGRFGLGDDMKDHKVYLGDGVYVWFDGYQIWLETTRNSTMHEIALEPEVMGALDVYRTELNNWIKENFK